MIVSPRGDGAAVEHTTPTDAPESEATAGAIARSVAIDGPTASGRAPSAAPWRATSATASSTPA